MVCAPDSQLVVRHGLENKAGIVWATASRSHLNLDFTFGAQPLGVAFTVGESVGGRVWPNVSFSDQRYDFALSVWGNSTLGLLAYWWHSSRQQSSKASITIRSAETLPVLDFRALSDDQLATAEAIFDEFRDKELKPAYLADADANRALLDRRVVCDLLGFDDGDLRGGAAAGGEVVRGAVGARGEGAAEGGGAGGVRGAWTIRLTTTCGGYV